MQKAGGACQSWCQSGQREVNEASAHGSGSCARYVKDVGGGLDPGLRRGRYRAGTDRSPYIVSNLQCKGFQKR